MRTFARHYEVHPQPHGRPPHFAKPIVWAAVVCGLAATSANAQDLSGTYRIKVKQSGRFLHVNAERGSDQLASTRVEIDDDYTRFVLKQNPDRSYTMRLKANNVPLHVDGLGDQLASTRGVADDDYTKYLLERQSDGSYRIRLKATGKYLHVDGEASRLLSTKFQVDDGYSRFLLVRDGGDGTPANTPAKVTGLNLTSVEKHSDDGLLGYFKQTGPKAWQESALNGDTRDWKEERRTQSSVFISSGGLVLELNIPKAGIFESDSSFRTAAQYYYLRNPVGKAMAAPSKPSSSPAPSSITGLNLTSAEKHSDDGLLGYFKQTGPKAWQESALNGDTRDWKEERRTQSSVFISSGGLVLELNIPKAGIFESDSSFRTAAQYYFLRNPVSKPMAAPSQPSSSPAPSSITGLNLTSVEKHSDDGLLGYFKQNGPKAWQESALNGDTRDWKEERRTQSSVFISSGGLVLELNIPKAGIFESDSSFRTAAQYYFLRNALSENLPARRREMVINPPKSTPSGSAAPNVLTGHNVTSFEVWYDGKPDFTYRQIKDRVWQFSNQFGPKWKMEVVARDRDSITLQEQGTREQIRATFSTKRYEILYDGKVTQTPANTEVRNAKHPGSRMKNLAAVDPNWYFTADQYASTKDLAAGTQQWGEVSTRIQRYEHSLYGYNFDRMHPYIVRVKGTKSVGRSKIVQVFKDIADDSREFYTTGSFAYPKQFLLYGMEGGKGNRSGQVFFSEYERQKAFSASASLEASAFGASVGIGGGYNQSKSTTGSSENASVFASSYKTLYWLTLNKEAIRLATGFTDLVKVTTSNDTSTFFLTAGTHYPLAVLYGGRFYYDEKVSKTALSQTLTSGWDVSASASGGAFGVDAAVSASYTQNKSNTQGSSKTVESVTFESVGGGGNSFDSFDASTSNCTPIKVELRPIYELIRPELFPGTDAQIVLAKRDLIKRAYNQLVTSRRSDDIRESAYEERSGISRAREESLSRKAALEGRIHERHGVNLNQKVKTYGLLTQEIGSPIMFMFRVTGSDPVSGTNSIRVTDSKRRPVNVVKIPGSKPTDVSRDWMCYLTAMPDVVNGRYEYYTNSTITIETFEKAYGLNKKWTFKLDEIPMSRALNTSPKEPKIKNPRFQYTFSKNAPNESGVQILGYAERAMERTTAGKDGLPLPAWRQ